MIRLFLNNTEIEIPDSLSINMVKESEIITDSSEWTFDFEISLSSKTNKRFFKNINRADVEKNIVKYDCRLMNSNEPILIGTAVVIQVSNDTINLQVLSGNSEVNYNVKNEKLYIDQIDLGSVFDDTFFTCDWDYYDSTGNFVEHCVINNVKNLDEFKRWLAVANHFYSAYITALRYGKDCNNEETGWFLLPAITNDGDLVNGLTLCVRQNNMKRVDYDTEGIVNILSYSFIRSYNQSTGDYIQGRKGYIQPWNRITAPQPTMWLVLQRVAKYLGYKLDKYDIDFYNDDRKNIYIPNVTETCYIKDMLPHWTITEFLSELENCLGVKVIFDGQNKVCKVISRNVYLENNEKIHLNNVLDDYTFEEEKDNQIDITSANVTFNISNDNLHCFPDTMENVKYEDYKSIEIIKAYVKPGQITPFGNEAEKIVARCGGRHFALYEGKLLEVNQLRDYRPIDSSSSISLKIRPPKMDLQRLSVVINNQTYQEAFIDDKEHNFFSKNDSYPTYAVPVVDRFGEYIDKFTIEEYIDGAKLNEKPDYIPIAVYHNMGTSKRYNVSEIHYDIDNDILTVPQVGGLTYGGDDSTMELSEPNLLLRLNETEGKKTLFNSSIKVGTKIESIQKFNFSFFDNVKIDFKKYYIIRGKRYICAKIEQEITKDGIKKIKKGEFYPVK